MSTIRVSDEVNERLWVLQREGESFNDLPPEFLVTLGGLPGVLPTVVQEWPPTRQATDSPGRYAPVWNALRADAQPPGQDVFRRDCGTPILI